MGNRFLGALLALTLASPGAAQVRSLPAVAPSLGAAFGAAGASPLASTGLSAAATLTASPSLSPSAPLSAPTQLTPPAGLPALPASAVPLGDGPAPAPAFATTSDSPAGQPKAPETAAVPIEPELRKAPDGKAAALRGLQKLAVLLGREAGPASGRAFDGSRSESGEPVVDLEDGAPSRRSSAAVAPISGMAPSAPRPTQVATIKKIEARARDLQVIVREADLRLEPLNRVSPDERTRVKREVMIAAAGMYREAQREGTGGFPIPGSMFDSIDAADRRTGFSSIYRDGHGSVVGFALAYFEPESGAVHLEKLGVSKGLRKSGLSKRMLQALARKAKAYGVPKVELLVLKDNAGAIAAYEKMGFVNMTPGPARADPRFNAFLYIAATDALLERTAH